MDEVKTLVMVGALVLLSIAVYHVEIWRLEARAPSYVVVSCSPTSRDLGVHQVVAHVNEVWAVTCDDGKVEKKS